MDSLLTILVIISLLANFLAILFLIKRKHPDPVNNEQLFKDELSSLKNTFSQSFGSMSKEIAKDMTGALTKVDEKVSVFNQQVSELNKSQDNFSRILSGVKSYGTLAEFGLGALLKDLLPASQYVANAKMKEDTSETVEFAIKLQDVMLPIDSHWPVEKYKAIDDAYNANDKDAQAEARKDLASAFRLKAKTVNAKYIAPPKSTDFAIVYVPTEGLFSELSSYRDPKTKELLLQELRTKYKVTISGPNTLSALLQSYHLGFQTLKVQQHATQIYNDLRNISSRFEKHFDGIKELRKKLEQAMQATDSFGRDARSIMNTLGNIKDPEQVEIASKNENVEKLNSSINDLMKWNTKFSYPKSTRSLINGSRHYSLDGSNLPSVTTILSATKSEEDKAAILAWKQRVGTVEAERIKKEASARGSSMHSYIEQFLYGKLNQELLEDNNKSKKMAEEIIDNGLKNKLLEIWGSEATIYYPGKYAGTADCIGVYEGKESILDFKQSNKPKKEEYIEDYFLQIGAYSLAHNTVYNSNITQGVILLCTVDRLFQDFKIEGNELINFQNKFLERVEKFYHLINK